MAGGMGMINFLKKRGLWVILPLVLILASVLPVQAEIATIQAPPSLNDLIDVNAGSPSDDDSLTWDAGTGKWIPKAVGGGAGLWEVDGTETQIIIADEIDMQSFRILNLLDPILNQDAATKKYVDDEVGPVVSNVSTLQGNVTAAESDIDTLEAASHTQDTDTQIQDADTDTKIQVEETSDEDIIRMDVEGTEAFFLNSTGILTLAEQSGGKAYAGSVQTIKGSATIYIMLDSESFDTQDEFDTTVVSGTAENIAGAKLKDTGVFTQDADYYTGRHAWNTADDTYTTVTGKQDNDTLTLTGDIFDAGEGFKLYFSSFTAKEDGVYLIIGAVRYASCDVDKRYYCIIKENGNTIGETIYHSSHATAISPAVTTPAYLVVGDVIQLATYTTGGNEDLAPGAGRVFLAVIKIA